MITRTIFCSLLVTCGSLAVQAQPLKLNNRTTDFGKTVITGDIPYLITGAEELLANYALNADLFDAEAGAFSTDKFGRFSELFTTDAKILVDFRENPGSRGASDMVSFTDYALEVNSELPQNGVRFALANPVLERVEYNEPTEHYTLTCLVDKKLFNYLDATNRVRAYPNGGQSYSLRFVLSSTKRSLNISRIEKILPAFDPAKPAAAPLPPVVVEKKETASPPVVVEKKETARPTAAPKPAKMLPASGGIVLETANAQFVNIPENLKNRLVESLEKALTTYQKVATLLDPNGQKVTDASATAFSKLFEDQAKVYDDVAEYAPLGLLNKEDYSSKIYNLLPRSGVKFKLGSARLNLLRDNGEGIYKAEILVDKIMLNYIDAKDRKERPVDQKKGGRVLPLLFTYKLDIDHLDELEISSIEPVATCPRAPKKVLYTFAGRVGLSTINGTLSDGASQNIGSDHLKLTAKNIFGGSVSWSSNSLFYREGACKKPLFLSIGFGYFQAELDAEFTDYRHLYEDISSKELSDNKPDGDLFFREPLVKNGIEVSNIKLVEGSLGLRWRILDKLKASAFIEADVQPMFLFDGKSNFRKGDSIFYDAIIRFGNENAAPINFRFSDNTSVLIDNFDFSNGGLFKAGRYGLNQTNPIEMTKGFGVSTRIGASFYKRLGYNIGLMVGVDYTFNLKSPISFSDSEFTNGISPTGHLSDIPDDLALRNVATVEKYFKNVGLHSLGLRVGVFLEFKK